MRLCVEPVTAAMLIISLYWVFADTEPQCYVQTNKDPYVAKWVDCDEIPMDWQILEVK